MKGLIPKTWGLGQHSEETDWAKCTEDIVASMKNDPIGQSENPAKVETSTDLIKNPLVDALGHSTNILIISLFLNRAGEGLTRLEIRSAIQAHKNEMNKQEDIFANSRIRDGKTTVNFWIDYLVDIGLLNRIGYPIKFGLNIDHDFVNLCRQMYAFGQTSPLVPKEVVV